LNLFKEDFMQYHIILKVNGESIELDVAPNVTLLEVLRDRLMLTGTKMGCGTGDCGACTMIVDGKAILSCLTLAVAVNGKEILTIEGVARDDVLDPVQEAFIQEGAIQCGYCTPGMVLSAKALLQENPRPTEEEIKLGIAGNLCRCTGYTKIVKAIQTAALKKDSNG
jgi:carbon-monoxide dehydrogenase small subunit